MSSSQADLYDLSFISSWIYRGDISSPAGQSALPAGWIVRRTETDPLVGFQAAELENTSTHEIVIAVRGTDDIQNLLEDFTLGYTSQLLPILNAVANDAIAFARQVAQANPGATITLTGHSLGGYAAEAALVSLTEAGYSNVSGVTFNAPGLPGWFLGASDPASFDCYNFNTQGDVIHLFGGVQIGKSTSLAVGPSASQEWSDYAGAFDAAYPFGARGAVENGVQSSLLQDWYQAHRITNFVGGDGIFSTNANFGSETAQQFFANNQQIPPSPQLSVSSDGTISLGDTAGDLLSVQGIDGNLQASLTPGSGLGVSDLSGLQSELQADGPAVVPQDLLNGEGTSLSGGSSLSGTVTADSAGETSAVIGNGALGGSSGLPGQIYVPGSTSDSRYECNIPVSGSVSEVIDSNGFGTVWVNSTLGYGQLTGGSPVQGTPDTWKDSNGTQYVFSGSPNSDIGTLTISGGLLGSDPANSVTIQNFNLAAAATSAGGFLGIQLGYAISLAAGTGASSGSSATFPAGSEQSYTLSVDAPGAQAETITVTLSGASPSDFDLDIGDECEQLNSNTFTITLPAGETSVSFGLIDVTQNDGTSDIAGGATLTLTASVTNPTDPNGSPIKSSPLSITYTPASQDTATGPQGGDPIPGQYDSVTGITTYKGDGGDDYISAGQGPNRILAQNSGSDSIVGGSGRNTIDGGSGNDVIDLNGSNDLVSLGTGYNTLNGGTGQDSIYAHGGTSIINGNGGTDLIFGGKATLVAGSGKTTIFGQAGNDCIGGGSATDVLGGSTLNDTPFAGSALRFGRIASRTRRYGRTVFSAVLLCCLAACSREHWPSTSSEIHPGAPDYPVTNPHPSHVLTIEASIPPALSVSISAIYSASPTAGGTMGSGTTCQRTVGLAVTAPFFIREPVRLVEQNQIFTAAVPIDGLLPGRCKWRFGGLTYSVYTAKSPPWGAYNELAVYAEYGGVAVEQARLDVWCMRYPKHQEIRPETCDTLESLAGYFPREIPESFVKTVDPSERNDGPPIRFGAEVESLQIVFHDLDQSNRR
jgi:hypothetical protein